MTELNFSILSPQELKIRRRWKRWFFAIHGPLAVLILLVLIVSLFSPEPPLEVFAAILGALLFFLPSYIFYYCAYTKAGTRLLTLFLFLQPVKILLIGGLFFAPFPLNLILTPILLSIFLSFYFLSWRLRKVNKKLQANLLYPEEYIAQIQQLTTWSSTDFGRNYRLLIQQWPQFAKNTRLHYKTRASLLNP